MLCEICGGKINDAGRLRGVSGFCSERCVGEWFNMGKSIPDDVVDQPCNQEPFMKDDIGKPRLELLEPKFLVGVGEILTFGAWKYGPNNWKQGGPDDIERIKGALLRHLMAYLNGERLDPETGKSHLYHIGCNTMFLDYFDRNMVDKPDDC